MMIDSLPRLAEGVFERVWKIIRLKEGEFFTCDLPVIAVSKKTMELEGRNTDDSSEMLGLSTAHALIYPLSRTVGIVMYLPIKSKTFRYEMADVHYGYHDGLMPENDSIVNLFQSEVIDKAQKYIFCNPNDKNAVINQV